MNDTRTLLIASNNPKKRLELERLLGPGGTWTLRTLAEFPDVPEAPEDEETFAGNAAAKALWYAERTGLRCLADDSGLEVDALGGAPGVHSARYAGHHGDDAANNAKLLRELAEVPDDRRTARFRCAVALARPGAVEHSAEGSTEGHILTAARGEGGFGYDPLFLSDDLGIAFGEAAPEAKDGVSHRGRALQALVAQLTPRS